MIGTVPGESKARPIRILSFSGQFPGSLYYHEESIARSKREFASWNGREFQFTFSENAKDVMPANLAKYDVLLLMNASGNYPGNAKQRAAFMRWVAKGHGVLSISSTSDGEYDWPQFAHIVGGNVEDHYILAPDSTTSNIPDMVAVNEDVTNPLVKHLGPTFAFTDETYKWKINPRADVHVLLSMDNLSHPAGPLFFPQQPLVWCREFGKGRTFHMAYGHSGFIFDSPGLVTTIKQTLRWEAGRLQADCSVPSHRGRLDAVWADKIVGGRAAFSSESGGLATVSDVPNGTGRLMWKRVNFNGVRSLELRAAGHNEPATLPGFAVPLPPPQPAAGGVIQARLDSPTGRLLGTFTVPGNPRWDRTNPAAGNTVPQPGWASYTISLGKLPVRGTHNLWLVAGPPGMEGMARSADAAGQTKYGVFGTIAWVNLVR